MPNPQDLVQFPATDPSQNRPFIYVGRMTEEKAPWTLAEAGKALGVPVRFVGEGPAMGRTCEANPQATFTGWRSAEEVREEIRNARAWC